ncbi:unnamed protein product [Spirodela intermedia]|uniref:Glutaredoxin domain-containing protein n=1 Tax=Spirodela intermedia TaxID=51605 RepID=A0A7I8IAI9_SPIIN|nr:unnamed protein product [Spirodela intermedia]CAA6654747.1 unnamed protein product [Spirodela intermedia]
MAAIHLSATGACSCAPSNPSFPFPSRPSARSQRVAASNRSFLLSSACLGGRSGSVLRTAFTGRRHGDRRRAAGQSSTVFICAVGKLSEADLLPVPAEPEGLEGKIPSGAGVYGVYDGNGDLQYVGISRNLVGSIGFHRKTVPGLCHSVKVGLVDGAAAAADRTVLTEAWKSWIQEHIDATGQPPPGNLSGNDTWTRRQKAKPNLRLTPGRHVQLTVPLEDLIDRLVKENRVVAFIKGSRSAPQCGFSQRVVRRRARRRVQLRLRETLKAYSNWPTFPQIFVKGELIGGCDILTAMETSGELSRCSRNSRWNETSLSLPLILIGDHLVFVHSRSLLAGRVDFLLPVGIVGRSAQHVSFPSPS